MSFSKLFVVLLVLPLLVFAAGAATESFDGTYQYAANYKALVDYDGFYFSEINKFSDLSSQDGVVTYYYVIEKPGLQVTWDANYTIPTPYGVLVNLTVGQTYDTTTENGYVNATVSYHYANGTTAIKTYTHYYDFLLNPEPMNFFIYLQRGDTALVNVYKSGAATNITRLQIVKDISNVEVEKRIFPTIDGMATGLNSILAIEVGIFGLVKNIAELAYMAFMVLVAPVLLVLLIIWAFRKIRESVTK